MFICFSKRHDLSAEINFTFRTNQYFEPFKLKKSDFIMFHAICTQYSYTFQRYGTNVTWRADLC